MQNTSVPVRLKTLRDRAKQTKSEIGLMLVVGCKGGVGVTALCAELAKAFKGVGLDLTDGQLAARLDRPAWLLSNIVFGSAAQQRGLVDDVVRQRPALLWTPECRLAADSWGFVRAVADRIAVIADGGIEPPEEAAGIVEQIVIVTADGDAAQWHTRRLQGLYPGAIVTPGTKEAIREFVGQLLGN